MSPEAIDAMLAAGCTAAQIASAVKADMAASAARIEEKRAARREGNRRRQAEWRIREKAKQHEDEITAVTPHNGVTERYGVPLKERSPKPPKEIHPSPTPSDPDGSSGGGAPAKPTPAKADAGKDRRLPEDFKPDLAFAVGKGMTGDRPALEAEKFCDFWRSKAGKDALKRDWPATWRTWVRKEIELNGLGDGQRQPRAPPGSYRSGPIPSSRSDNERQHRRPSGSFADCQDAIDAQFNRLGPGGSDREEF